MRLVNADEAPVYLNETGCEQIKRMPTVDAVEVVRCKDCKSFVQNEENNTFCRCIYGLTVPEENDFCSYGKRRANDD